MSVAIQPFGGGGIELTESKIIPYDYVQASDTETTILNLTKSGYLDGLEFGSPLCYSNSSSYASKIRIYINDELRATIGIKGKQSGWNTINGIIFKKKNEIGFYYTDYSTQNIGLLYTTATGSYQHDNWGFPFSYNVQGDQIKFRRVIDLNVEEITIDGNYLRATNDNSYEGINTMLCGSAGGSEMDFFILEDAIKYDTLRITYQLGYSQSMTNVVQMGGKYREVV